VTRLKKAGLIVVAAVLLVVVATLIGCSVRKRMYVDDNIALLNDVPVYPGARELHTDRDSEYRDPDASELSPPKGWSSHRVYAVPQGVRMTQVLQFYERELTRRGWRKQSPDCGPGSFEKGEARILVNAGAVNAHNPHSSLDVAVDVHGADEC
jgi:hypothetical protein